MLFRSDTDTDTDADTAGDDTGKTDDGDCGCASGGDAWLAGALIGAVLVGRRRG